MLLYVSMAGMAMLFFMLTAMFLFRTGDAVTPSSFSLPKLFSVSTILILVSGFYMQQVPGYYAQDDLTSMKKGLMWSLLLGVLFAVAQIVAWYEMASARVFFDGHPAGTFLYLLSALHLLHIAGGLAFASYLYVKVNRAAGDPIRSLIFIRDPYRLMQVQMLRSYWQFLDVVWIALYFIFLFAL
ncbi:heme-copper oxidase subunit III [Rufibacter sediminis]|uniref:Cytochrome c oxidase subunit III n=1 Tax=Rufibacter sediminis TaxID=2762756 RepID=A0ABR6VSY6_9BACT|nr:cytochrome c oxidase subunit III [Rufibacter sediminis]MBC3540266.1 cytochrome c oxidase subunit III [Rufibacter sediminis]